jgi:hypothetical protein
VEWNNTKELLGLRKPGKNDSPSGKGSMICVSENLPVICDLLGVSRIKLDKSEEILQYFWCYLIRIVGDAEMKLWRRPIVFRKKE